jgi:hypothetical protein
LNQKRKQLSALEDAYDCKIIVAGDNDMFEASEYKISKEKMAITTEAASEAATTCYEEDNVGDDTEDNEVEDEEIVEDTDNDNRRERYRRNGRNRRFRRNERRQYPAQPTPEPEPEKKSWWKRLIG